MQGDEDPPDSHGLSFTSVAHRLLFSLPTVFFGCLTCSAQGGRLFACPLPVHCEAAVTGAVGQRHQDILQVAGEVVGNVSLQRVAGLCQRVSDRNQSRREVGEDCRKEVRRDSVAWNRMETRGNSLGGGQTTLRMTS